MKQNINIVIFILMVWGLGACENPYDQVSEEKYYSGNPFVSLSSEQAAIRLGISKNNNQIEESGVFKDSLVLSHKLDHDITVFLEIVDEESLGNIDEHYAFEDRVVIEVGHYYGSFTVRNLGVPEDEVSKYKLSIRIKEVNDEQVIAGLYGIKKENEERKKRFKTYSFQK